MEKLSRFRELFMMQIWPHKPNMRITQEFLLAIKTNFFDSLIDHPVKLDELDEMNWGDLDNIKIVMYGKYSSHNTKYTLVLDKKLKVKKLLVL